MRKIRIIYINFNDCSGKYPNSITDGDAFYTHGWGSLMAREFKKNIQDYEVECWKADSRVKKQYTKTISGVIFKIFPAIHIKKLGFFSWQLAKELKKNVGSGKVIVNISSGRHLLFYQLAPLCRKILLVLQHHGETTSIFDLKYRKGFLSKLRALLMLLPEYLAFINVNHYFLLDERLINFLPETFKGTYSIQTTGVDPEIFHPLDKEEARRKLGLPINMKYILYIGRIGDHKRFDILLEIYRELKQERDNVQLLVAGNRTGDKYEQEAKKSGVIIYGIIKQTELYKFLSAADVYVLPGYKNIHTFGGIGMLPLQAGLCNTPTVGATLNTIPVEIRENIGIYSEKYGEIKKGIEAILDKRVKFREMRASILSTFTWEIISYNTKALYDKYLER
ncbi:MAG: glycosyltransferase family 4 protein [Saprospiraceae bacterium]|nr:glycosyltransferase family 4 protein [Saprospiraceae bacterium]